MSGKNENYKHTLWTNLRAYCFAAAAILPPGLMPLFSISSPSFLIGIPSMYSMTRAFLQSKDNTRKQTKNSFTLDKSDRVKGHCQYSRQEFYFVPSWYLGIGTKKMQISKKTYCFFMHRVIMINMRNLLTVNIHYNIIPTDQVVCSRKTQRKEINKDTQRPNSASLEAP